MAWVDVASSRSKKSKSHDARSERRTENSVHAVLAKNDGSVLFASPQQSASRQCSDRDALTEGPTEGPTAKPQDKPIAPKRPEERSEEQWDMKNHYHTIVDTDNFGELVNDGWDYWSKDEPGEVHSGVKVVVLGDFNKGKSFVAGRLASVIIPTGCLVHTTGISVIYIRLSGGKHIALVDTKGTGSPITGAGRKELMMKKAEENFAREVAFRMSNVVLYVTGFVNSDDQLKLGVLSEELQLPEFGRDKCSRVIVVHNVQSLNSERLIREYASTLERLYPQCKPQTFCLHDKNIEYLEGFHADNLSSTNQTHVIFGDDYSLDCQPWNQAALALIRDRISAFVPLNYTFDLRKDLVGAINVSLPRYFQAPPPVEVSIVPKPNPNGNGNISLLRLSGGTVREQRLGYYITRTNADARGYSVVKYKRWKIVRLPFPGVKVVPTIQIAVLTKDGISITATGLIPRVRQIFQGEEDAGKKPESTVEFTDIEVSGVVVQNFNRSYLAKMKKRGQIRWIDSVLYLYFVEITAAEVESDDEDNWPSEFEYDDNLDSTPAAKSIPGTSQPPGSKVTPAVPEKHTVEQCEPIQSVVVEGTPIVPTNENAPVSDVVRPLGGEERSDAVPQPSSTLKTAACGAPASKPITKPSSTLKPSTSPPAKGAVGKDALSPAI